MLTCQARSRGQAGTNRSPTVHAKLFLLAVRLLPAVPVPRAAAELCNAMHGAWRGFALLLGATGGRAASCKGRRGREVGLRRAAAPEHASTDRDATTGTSAAALLDERHARIRDAIVRRCVLKSRVFRHC